MVKHPIDGKNMYEAAALYAARMEQAFRDADNSPGSGARGRAEAYKDMRLLLQNLSNAHIAGRTMDPESFVRYIPVQEVTK